MDGENNISTGSTSNLPIIMHAIKTILLKLENSKKLPIGPTTSSPGPILLIVAITDENDVAKSKLSKETIMTEKIIIII